MGMNQELGQQAADQSEKSDQSQCGLAQAQGISPQEVQAGIIVQMGLWIWAL